MIRQLTLIGNSVVDPDVTKPQMDIAMLTLFTTVLFFQLENAYNVRG